MIFFPRKKKINITAGVQGRGEQGSQFVAPPLSIGDEPVKSLKKSPLSLTPLFLRGILFKSKLEY